MFQCSRRLFNIKKKAVPSKANVVDTQIAPYSLPTILHVPNLSILFLKNPKNVLTLSCEASSLNFILEKSIVWSKVFEFHWTTATYFPHNFPYTFSKGLSFTQVIENRKIKFFLLSPSLSLSLVLQIIIRFINSSSNYHHSSPTHCCHHSFSSP